MQRNITLSAEEKLIKLARKKALKENSSLNEKFRKWLQNYVNKDFKSQDYKNIMKKLNYAKPGRKFSREEMNER